MSFCYFTIPMEWILSLFISKHIFPNIKWFAGIMTNKCCTFQWSGGTPPTCRNEPANPWHQVRVFGQMALGGSQNGNGTAVVSRHKANLNCLIHGYLYPSVNYWLSVTVSIYVTINEAYLHLSCSTTYANETNRNFKCKQEQLDVIH